MMPAPPATINMLELKTVHMRFGELHALNNISFKVEPGELFGLAGPNGSGKTTLFNVVTGVYRGSGAIILDGKNINGLRPHQVCHRGLVRTFQTPAVFSTLTVYQNVQVGAHFGKARVKDEAEKIAETIEFVGLGGKERLLAGSLPLFERKLTMLAATLATGPKVLLLDEPMGGLSPTEIERSMKLFRRIHTELNMTMIVIEHLMRELVGLCQRLMIIHYGEQVVIGPPEEVVNDSRVIEVYLGRGYARSQ
ncbi:MAG: ABC transporter ATP-binding protein [Dehalococcoidia bacterium]|nr:ABC transporter ATP-binding protein [Dehalococcoidia bacterium]